MCDVQIYSSGYSMQTLCRSNLMEDAIYYSKLLFWNVFKFEYFKHLAPGELFSKLYTLFVPIVPTSRVVSRPCNVSH